MSWAASELPGSGTRHGRSQWCDRPKQNGWLARQILNLLTLVLEGNVLSFTNVYFLKEMPLMLSSFRNIKNVKMSILY